jgi:hypothetical protein
MTLALQRATRRRANFSQSCYLQKRQAVISLPFLINRSRWVFGNPRVSRGKSESDFRENYALSLQARVTCSRDIWREALQLLRCN